MIEFTSKISIGAWRLLLSKVIGFEFNIFSTEFNFFNRYRAIQIVCFILCQFWYLSFSKNLSKFSNILGEGCLYYFFIILLMFCSDTPLFIPDIFNSCLFSVLVKIQAQNKSTMNIVE